LQFFANIKNSLFSLAIFRQQQKNRLFFLIIYSLTTKNSLAPLKPFSTSHFFHQQQSPWSPVPFFSALKPFPPQPDNLKLIKFKHSILNQIGDDGKRQQRAETEEKSPG
jgi:hypothetical protein